MPPFAGKKCQQYGHSCLGGHGKRSSSPPLMGLFTNSRIGAASGSSPYSSSSEQLFYGAPRPSSAAAVVPPFSHTFPSSSNFKLPLVYTLLSSAFPLRKVQQLRTQQPSWKSLQESSSSSDLADWADQQQQSTETQFLVPVPQLSGLPTTATDPEGDLREGLNSALTNNNNNNNNYHRVSSGERKGPSSSAADWELPAAMKKADGVLSRFRRSLLAGGRVASLQLQHPQEQLKKSKNQINSNSQAAH